jgi:lysyl-tRNA synthetase class 2
MMERYRHIPLQGMMDITERLIARCATEACGTTDITYQGREIHLAPPFERLTMAEAVRRYAGVDFDSIADAEEALETARRHGIEEGKRGMSKGEVLNLFFEHFAEEKLIHRLLYAIIRLKFHADITQPGRRIGGTVLKSS